VRHLWPLQTWGIAIGMVILMGKMVRLNMFKWFDPSEIGGSLFSDKTIQSEM
jgi:hypothetical protein